MVAQAGPSRRRLESDGQAPGHRAVLRGRAGLAFNGGATVCALHPQSLPPPAGPVHRTMVRASPYSSTSTPTGQWSEPIRSGHMKAPCTRFIAAGEAST